ncbi:TPA: hypothetical protein I8Y10_000972 [Kluyvera cryocrescens]|nr:hypothetical protein [Kluyvera cryocrescens]
MKLLEKRKLKLAFVACFLLLILLPLLVVDGYYSEYFYGNLLPEFTGVTLEFIIILYVIDYIQNRNELNNKKSREKIEGNVYLLS